MSKLAKVCSVKSINKDNLKGKNGLHKRIPISIKSYIISIRIAFIFHAVDQHSINLAKAVASVSKKLILHKTSNGDCLHI
jgi:hypothetical protein